MAAATGWEDYLANSSINVGGLQRRLEDPDGILFSDDDTNVRITDVGDGERPLQRCSTSGSNHP